MIDWPFLFILYKAISLNDKNIIEFTACDHFNSHAWDNAATSDYKLWPYPRRERNTMCFVIPKLSEANGYDLYTKVENISKTLLSPFFKSVRIQSKNYGCSKLSIKFRGQRRNFDIFWDKLDKEKIQNGGK